MNQAEIVRRREALWALGCIACRREGFYCVRAEIHHLNLDGKAGQARRGEEFTIPLCPWHHQGKPVPALTIEQTRETYGPSLKLESRKFRERYGSDDTLLAATNLLIGVTPKAVPEAEAAFHN